MIRNVPDELHEALKERARVNRRSLNQEVIAELMVVVPPTDEQKAAAARERWKRVNEGVADLRSRMKGFMTPEEIKAAIEEGRR